MARLRARDTADAAAESRSRSRDLRHRGSGEAEARCRLKVQSVPRPGEKPQIFETVEPLAEARPAWNAMRPWQDEAHALGSAIARPGSTASHAISKPAMRWCSSARNSSPTEHQDNWDFRVLTAVDRINDNNLTRVTWKRGLGSSRRSPIRRKIRRCMRCANGRRRSGTTRRSGAPCRLRSDPVSSDSEATRPRANGRLMLSPSSAAGRPAAISISKVRSIGPMCKRRRRGVAGSTRQGRVQLRQRTGSREGPTSICIGSKTLTEVSRAEFALSGKVTRLTLPGELRRPRSSSHVRETAVYAQSEPLPWLSGRYAHR